MSNDATLVFQNLHQCTKYNILIQSQYYHSAHQRIITVKKSLPQ